MIRLLTLADKFGINEQGSVDIVLIRQDSASFAGTTYETVFRILNEFIEEKIIVISGKDILIKIFGNYWKLPRQ